MPYFAKVRTGKNNISLKELYQQKGVNLMQDKTQNLRLAPYGSNTEGSHLGREVNPWWSAQLGGGTDRTGGMVQFNDPLGYFASGTYEHEVRLGTLSGMDKWFFPLNPFIEADDRAFSSNVLTLHDGAYNPGWNQNFHYNIFIYANKRDGLNGEFNTSNWVSSVRRSNGQVRMSVGKLLLGNGGNVAQATIDASVNYTSIFSQIAPLNVGQGDEDPYNEGGPLGGSTQIGAIYRNSSANERYRITEVNTTTAEGAVNATISLGPERALATFGNPVFLHGAINMGKGVMWAPYHRGANYARIAYLNWTSGTTATNGSVLMASRGSTNTLYPGEIIKASDELAFWFYSRRNGQSSGNARAISVAVVAPSGANKVPTLRGSFDLATYDVGSTTIAGCTAAVGGSTDPDYLTGIVVWAQSDTQTAYVLPWNYRISTNTFNFATNRIIPLDAFPNSYRTRNSIVHIGTSRDGYQNFYEVSISGDGGTRVYGITANSDIAGADYALTLSSQHDPASTFGNNVQRSTSIRYSPGGKNEQMMWFSELVQPGYDGTIQTLHLYTDTGLLFKLGLHQYKMPQL